MGGIEYLGGLLCSGLCCLLFAVVALGGVVWLMRRGRGTADSYAAEVEPAGPSAAQRPSVAPPPPPRPMMAPLAPASPASFDEDMATVVAPPPPPPSAPPPPPAPPPKKPAPPRSAGATIIAFDDEEES